MKQCSYCGHKWSINMHYCPIDGELLSIPENDYLIGCLLENKYLIESKIGHGAAGTVYKARRLVIEDEVAVKVLKPELVADSAAVERFRREAIALGRIRHPNAIAVYDFGITSDGIAFLVTELLVGQTLRQILKIEKVLDLYRVVQLFGQICAALHTAHRHDIIHRDLKPENILVENFEGKGEVVKVIDFGLAKLCFTEDYIKTLTKKGRVVGTPYYMSPEQWMGKDIDEKVDIYALGIMLYEALTGHVPFEASTVIELANKHVKSTPSPLMGSKREFPKTVSDVVLRAIAKSPEDRQTTALDLAHELTEAAEYSLPPVIRNYPH